MRPPKKLSVLASLTTFIVDTSAAVAASMVAQWLVAATVHVVLFSVAACPPVAVELCEEREVSVEIRRAAAMISPPMLAKILSAEVDSVHGAESSSAKQLIYRHVVACVGDELCEFLLFGLCRFGRTHVFRNCIQLLFNSSELLHRSVIMLTRLFMSSCKKLTFTL